VQDGPQDWQLSYTSDEGGRKSIRKSESFEVEEDLLNNIDNIKNEYKYTTWELQGEDDLKIRKSGENGEEVESDR